MNYYKAGFLAITFTPKGLNLLACGMPSGNFANPSHEGYRTPLSIKITPLTPTGANAQTKPQQRKKPLNRKGARELKI
jgi:hypothetical protein